MAVLSSALSRSAAAAEADESSVRLTDSGVLAASLEDRDFVAPPRVTGLRLATFFGAFCASLCAAAAAAASVSAFASKV